MATLLVCTCGHSWEEPVGDASTCRSACPVCGSRHGSDQASVAGDTLAVPGTLMVSPTPPSPGDSSSTLPVADTSIPPGLAGVAGPPRAALPVNPPPIDQTLVQSGQQTAGNDPDTLPLAPTSDGTLALPMNSALVGPATVAPSAHSASLGAVDQTLALPGQNAPSSVGLSGTQAVAPSTSAVPGTRYPSALPSGVSAAAPGMSKAASLGPKPGGAVPPRVVAGYEILGELGRGGMGVVYKGRHQKLHRVVALKMIRGGAQAGREELVRFRLEAEAVARMQHPNIVQIYEIGEHDGLPFFSLEFISGGTLHQRLAGATMPAREAAVLVETLARAIHYAHQRGIVHRDLKPANIMLEGEAEAGDVGRIGNPSQPSGSLVPKITDFGLAKNLGEDAGQTGSGSILGTPSYMAPEQAQGRTRDIGPPADIYALGAILYDLLTGRPPFRGDTVMETLNQVIHVEPLAPTRLHPRLARDLETICLKCLHKDVPRRYASAQELADDLRRFLDGESILARPTTPMERAVKWVRRRPAGAALLAVSVAALLALGGAGYLLALNERGKSRAEFERAEAQLARTQAESERAEAERQKAEVERNRANTEKNLRTNIEQERDRANTNFRRAMLAIDKSLTVIGQDRLAAQPNFAPIRRQLLVQAVTFYSDFLKEREALEAVRPEAARGYLRLGSLRETLGEKPQAEADYRKSIDLCIEELGRHPAQVEVLRTLVAAAGDLAVLLHSEGRFEEAEQTFAVALQHWQQSAIVAPSDAATSLLESHGDLLLNRGNLRATTARTVSGGEVASTLPSWLARLAGPALVAQRQADALADIVAAIDAFRKLKQDAPTVPAYRAKLARAYTNLASLRGVTHPDLAEADFANALVLLRGLSREPVNKEEYRFEKARLCVSRAAFRVASVPPGRSALWFEVVCAAALQDLDEAVATLENLVADQRDVRDYRRTLALALNNRALILRSVGLWREAEKAWRQVLQVADALRDEPEFARLLGLALNEQGIALAASTRNSEADQAWLRAIEIQEARVKATRRNPQAWQDLVESHTNRTLLFDRLDQTRDAIVACRLLVSAQGRRASLFPNDPRIRHDNAQSLAWLANLLEQDGQPELAVPERKRAVAEERAAVVLAPQDAVVHQALAELLLTSGDVRGAAAAVAEWRRLVPAERGRFFEAAAVLARCAERLGSSTEEGRRCADEAIELLRLATDHGFRDVVWLEGRAEFTMLHDRADFQAVVTAVKRGAMVPREKVEER
jgi:serine/threonine protein kinase/tetratricopeptide (TPR) repeat protein